MNSPAGTTSKGLIVAQASKLKFCPDCGTPGAAMSANMRTSEDIHSRVALLSAQVKIRKILIENSPLLGYVQSASNNALML
jgi:hypothetical protein